MPMPMRTTTGARGGHKHLPRVSSKSTRSGSGASECSRALACSHPCGDVSGQPSSPALTRSHPCSCGAVLA